MKATRSLGSLQYGIIVLTVLTALMHLGLAIPSFGSFPVFGVLFLLNGIGYLALLAGLYFIPALAPQRSLIRWALIGFAAVTIIAYFVLNAGDYNAVGLANKAIEIALVILLFLEK